MSSASSSQPFMTGIYSFLVEILNSPREVSLSNSQARHMVQNRTSNLIRWQSAFDLLFLILRRVSTRGGRGCNSSYERASPVRSTLTWTVLAF